MGKKNRRLEQRTGIAMLSTKDSKFSKFYCKEEIINGDVYYASKTRRKIQTFIKEAYAKYISENKKNNLQKMLLFIDKG